MCWHNEKVALIVTANFNRGKQGNRNTLEIRHHKYKGNAE